MWKLVYNLFKIKDSFFVLSYKFFCLQATDNVNTHFICFACVNGKFFKIENQWLVL